MEWIISGGITLLIVFILVCFIIDKENYNYYFREFSVKEKIARVTIYAVGIGFTCGLLGLLTWAIKEIIF